MKEKYVLFESLPVIRVFRMPNSRAASFYIYVTFQLHHVI